MVQKVLYNENLDFEIFPITEKSRLHNDSSLERISHSIEENNIYYNIIE